MWKVLLSVLLAFGMGLLGLAQENDAEVGSIYGTVVDAETGQALAGVRIGIAGSLFRTMTDRDGRFALGGIPSGEYLLTAELPGYVSARRRNVRLPSQGGLPVRVATGQRSTGEVLLLRSGTAVGQVLNGEGEALSGVTVTAFRYTFADNGDRVITNYGETRTNDLGLYRFVDLDPASYFLKYEIKPAVPSARLASFAYAVFYYPGRTDQGLAEEVVIEVGRDVRLNPMLLYDPPRTDLRVNIMESTSAVSDLSLELWRAGGTVPVEIRASRGPRSTEEFTSLAAGTYEIKVRSDTGAYGRATVVIRPDFPSHEVGVVLVQDVMLRGYVKMGELTLNSTALDSAQVFEQLNVHAVLIDITPGRSPLARKRISLGASVPDEVPLQPGKYSVDVHPPEGMFVASILASDSVGDLDVLRNGLSAESGDTTLTVVLGVPAGSVRGIVMDETSQPIALASVVVVMEGDADHFVRTATSNVDGEFEIGALGPGSYRVYSWRELDGAAYRNHDFMREVLTYGLDFSIEAGETVELVSRVLE